MVNKTNMIYKIFFLKTNIFFDYFSKKKFLDFPRAAISVLPIMPIEMMYIPKTDYSRFFSDIVYSKTFSAFFNGTNFN